MSTSTYLANTLLDQVLGGQAWTPPTTLYVALFTVAPGVGGGGTEVTGGSYSRATVTNNLTNFPAASSGAKANGTAITFITPTADWGTVVAMGIFDASLSGNLLLFQTLSQAKAVYNGDPVSFQIGALTESMT